MSVTTYLSTDSGAPVINGTSGNGIPNVLTTCLAGTGTAYGSLPKKGWTVLFSGTNKVVLQTVDGIGILRVAQDGSNTGGFREALVRAAESATNVDTLVDLYPNTTEVTAGNETWRATDTLDTTARPWMLVADDNWLILCIRFGTSAADMYIFGRFSSAISSNSWPYVINCRNISNSTSESSSNSACGFAVGFAGGFSSQRLFAMRTPDGLTKSPRATFVTSSCAQSSSLGYGGAVGPKIPNAAGVIVKTPPQLWINGASGASAVNPEFAGYFPNLWSPLYSFSAAGRAVVYGDTFTSPGYDAAAQFILTGPFNDTLGKWIVETTSTWKDPLS